MNIAIPNTVDAQHLVSEELNKRINAFNGITNRISKHRNAGQVVSSRLITEQELARHDLNTLTEISKEMNKRFDEAQQV